MAEQRKTIRKTKTYNGTLYRNDVPAGVFIHGWGDDTRFFADTDNPYMKAGWWVPVGDTMVVVTEPEEPGPEPIMLAPDELLARWRNKVTGEVVVTQEYVKK